MRTGETAFTDKVTLTCLPPDSETEAFIAWITDLTQGQSRITEGQRLYFIEGE